jgi:hypothetical protein
MGIFDWDLDQMAEAMLCVVLVLLIPVLAVYFSGITRRKQD